MLDGLHGDIVPRQTRGQLNAGQMLNGGRYLVVAEIGPAEADPEIGRGRLQREMNLVAGVKADPHTGDWASKCTLCVHEPLKSGGRAYRG